jgi:hypothetical protein
MQKKHMYLAIAGAVALTTAGIAIGRSTAPQDKIDREVQQDGVFNVDTVGVLSSTVESLRAQNKLVVYDLTGAVNVTTGQTHFWGMIKGIQRMSVPATVSYHINMAELKDGDVHFDAVTRRFSMTLPALKLGDVAFQPEQAIIQSNGVMTISDDTVQEFSRENYGTARRAFVKMAQQNRFSSPAKEHALAVVSDRIKSELKTAGIRDVDVSVKFRESNT